jgi:hypothetical protein
MSVAKRRVAFLSVAAAALPSVSNFLMLLSAMAVSLYCAGGNSWLCALNR